MSSVSRPASTRQPTRSTETKTPEAMLAALVAQEPGAMEQIMASYRRVVYGAARRVLRTGPDIEDVVQDTWLALATHASRIRNPNRLGAWLWATASNAALAVSVRQRRVSCWDLSDSDHAPQNDEEPLASMFAEQRRVALQAALTTISAKELELIGLLVATPRPCYREVSKTVGRPVGSLGPTRVRILAKLRAEMRNELSEAC